MSTLAKKDRLILWFDEVQLDDLPFVGGKNASLGEMYQSLSKKGIQVPNGFAVTAMAYQLFIEKNKLGVKIDSILKGLDTHDLDNLRQRGLQIRQAILSAAFPRVLEEEITKAYDALSAERGIPVDVAVRSSATAEDLPDASFAGQQETYLNVQGRLVLLETCKRCFASLFTDRAISYRKDKGFAQHRIALSIGVQHMVRSDLSTAGVMFSIDTETGFRNAVLINAAYGLGENVVQGSVNPDEYTVFKPTLKTGFRPILQKTLGSKEFKLIYDLGGGKRVKNVPVAPGDRARFALSDDEILTLSRWACLIEDHYSARKGVPSPMDIEWAKDGKTGGLYIVQARPETVQSQKNLKQIESYSLTGPRACAGKEKARVLVTGRSVGEKIGQGPVRIIKNVQDLHTFHPGDVLVTDKTDPDWEPVMKKAAAIVTNRGGRTCHAAIVSRELGLPAIVGTEQGTEILKDGQAVTISCAEGETGYVYEGTIPFDVEHIDFSEMPRPKTQIMVNVANPAEAFRLAALPNDGVGLAREEFIISSYIQIHPMALVHYDDLKDPAVKQEIDRLTAAYEDKPQFFVDKLAEGVSMIAAAFYPKEVIVRLSDFKTNEYANLIGGSPFEPIEANPMLGFRGASRYTHPRYREGFALECKAMKKVRDEMGLTNLKLMVPFCRTVEEGQKVLDEMASHGLRRGENGLEVYVMCEIPSNVVLAEDFADIFDGFSIGSNDLTQLVLGVDRDSEIIAHLFDERNPAVKKTVASVIQAAKAKGRKIGICGQAPSDYPDFSEFLVAQGIDSISLNPDRVMKTTLLILEMERALHE